MAGRVGTVCNVRQYNAAAGVGGDRLCNRDLQLHQDTTEGCTGGTEAGTPVSHEQR